MKEYENEWCPFRDECGETCSNSVDEHRCEYFQNLIKGRLVYLPLDELYPHPDNPRKDLGDLSELTESIRANGILQNLTVVPQIRKEDNGSEWTEGYRVVIGHRRMAAAKKAGLEKVPCVIANMTQRQQLGTMLLENMQRSDLKSYEQAEGFQLMLDLGETVTTIAKQTGLSESTIRRRVKLTELNKEELQKAELRGGTLKDYEKLSKITDPGERNKVLQAVGTANFQAEYSRAIRDQSNQKYLQDTAKAIRESGWCRELTAEELAELRAVGKLEWYRNYNPWRKDEVEEPKDAVQRQYYFVVYEGQQIDLYRERIHQEKVETPAERKKRELRDQLERIESQLQQQEQDFRDRRESFIDGFSAYDTYEYDICAFAVRAMLFRMGPEDSGEALEEEELCGMLNIAHDGEQMDQKDLQRVLFNRPQSALLATAYFMLEDGCRRNWEMVWSSDLRMRIPRYCEDKQLELLYQCLRSLHYEWSTDEQRACVGDDPLLGEAEELIAKYKQEAGQEE